jgi:translation initiation factor 3 subunit H
MAQAIEEGWTRSEAPKRMESLLMSNQIRTYCDQVEKFTGDGFGKLFLTSGLHTEEGEKKKAAA